MDWMRVESVVIYYKKEIELSHDSIECLKKIEGVKGFEQDERYYKVLCEPQDGVADSVKNKIFSILGIGFKPLR